MTIKVLWWKYHDNICGGILRVYKNENAKQAQKDFQLITDLIGDDKKVFLDNIDFFNPILDASSCIDGEMDNFIPAYPPVTQPPRPIVKKEDSTPKKGIIKPDSILVKSDPYCLICFKSDFCNIKNDNVIPSWCPFKKAMDEHFIFLNKSKP